MKKTAFLAAVLVGAAAVAQQAASPLLNRFRPAAARSAVAATSPDAEPPKPGTVSIEFNQTPLDLVLDVYQNLVGKTVLKDPGVPSPALTLKPKVGQKLSDEEKIHAIEALLEMNGVHFEPYGDKFVRALPRGKVRKEGIPLIMDPDAEIGESSRVVSLKIDFKNISAQDEAQKALEGFKSDSGILLVFERTNSIIVTDTEQNIRRMLEIARMIDVATPILENVFVRQVRHAAANDIKTALETIVQESQKELEKNGKGAPNSGAAAQPQPAVSRLLRPGAARPQPQPVNNASLVMSVSDADRGMIRGKVLILADERSNKLIIVTQKSNMDFFDKVIEQLDVATTPDTQVKVYRLKYAEAEEVSDMINDLIGNASNSKSTGNQNQNAKAGTGGNLTRGGGSPTALNTQRKSANQKGGEAKAGELTKDNTVVLADKRINGLVVMTQKELVPVIEQIIESMDVKLSQVLIETVIIEVTLGDGLNTGIDWVQNGRYRQDTERQVRNALGQNLYYTRRTYDDGSTSIIPSANPLGYKRVFKGDDGSQGYTDEVDENCPGVFEKAGEVLKDAFWTGSAGFAQMFGGGANGGNVAADVVSGVASNLFGSAINYVFKSDKLNLSAVIKASKTDSRSKYLASPIVMTVDNKEATIEATEMRYLFKGYQYSGSTYNGSAVPDYEQKELGITIKMTPKINPNGTIMLTVETEYSQPGDKQEIAGQDGTPFLAENTVTRKMSADVLLENMQTAILGGLTKTFTSSSETGIPILKDIPFIGKWLFGSVTESESRSELLIFMQPYVLDEGDAAQAEAIRRKKSLSDARPWEDHGWSLSELADPVDKKELLRRLKAEWAKQDEERKTKLAIEAEKVKRAKRLREMSKEERDFWIEMHKDEIEDDEKQEEFERKVEELKQDELRRLATEIRERKMREAAEELKKADEDAKSQNERGRLEAERRDEAADPAAEPSGGVSLDALAPSAEAGEAK